MTSFVAKFQFKSGHVRTFMFGEFHQLGDIVDGERDHGWGDPVDVSDIEWVEIMPAVTGKRHGEIERAA